MTPKERRKAKAVKRSQMSAPAKKKQRTESDLVRLEAYKAKVKRKEILSRQFSI